jgi:hypothetical protein
VSGGRRTLTVSIIGDAASLERAMGKSRSATGAFGDSAEKSHGKLSRLSKYAAGAAVGAIGALGLAMTSSVKAAVESEKSQAKLETQLKALGISYSANAKHIDTAIQKTSQLSGLDDEELAGSFTNIVRVTGDVNEALRLNGLAADIARAKGVSLEAASKAVSKAAGGQAGALGRLGVVVKEGATGQEALAAAQQKFSGQAESYGKTAAGAQDRFKVATENLQEALGSKLLPVVADVANALAKGVGWLEKHETVTKVLIGTVGAFAGVLALLAIQTKVTAAATAVWTAATWALSAAMYATPVMLIVAGLALLVAGLVVAWNHSETFRNIVTGAFDAVKSTASAVFGWLKTAVVNVASFLVARWENIKTAVGFYWNAYRALIINPIRSAFASVRGAVENVVTFLGDRWEDIKSAASTAWDAVRSNIVSPIREGFTRIREIIAGKGGLVDWLGDRWEDIKKAADKMAAPFVAAFKTMSDGVKKVLDYLGKVVDAIRDVIKFLGNIKVPKISLPDLNPFGGFGGGNVGPGGSPPSSVDGFNDDAARFGNVVTSGYRPGDDGWHGQNRARDYAGGDMIGFARYMALNFGSRLLELIHTPLGFGIKNGQTVPMSYFGSAVAADHYDHVHVAMAQGGIVRARVGEMGPEDVYLPRGSRVVANHETGGSGVRDVYLTRSGNVTIGSQKAARVMANRLAFRAQFG